MNPNTTPSALAIRRATRVRELNRMRRTQLEALFRSAARSNGYAYVVIGDTSKENLINEILHLEGLEMTVLE